jgi:acetylornithine/succinyldiaminopimelate/putrescine aminotransferase
MAKPIEKGDLDLLHIAIISPSEGARLFQYDDPQSMPQAPKDKTSSTVLQPIQGELGRK